MVQKQNILYLRKRRIIFSSGDTHPFLPGLLFVCINMSIPRQNVLSRLLKCNCTIYILICLSILLQHCFGYCPSEFNSRPRGNDGLLSALWLQSKGFMWLHLKIFHAHGASCIKLNSLLALPVALLEQEKSF